MDERLRTFLLIAGSGAFLGLLGAAFGAVTGAMYWRSGKAAGTAAGLRVAQAFERAARRPSSVAMRGVLVGAVDGFLFLGVLGILTGAVLAYGGYARFEVLTAVALGAVLTMLAAVGFGLLAYGLARAGVWALPAVFAGAVLGGFGGMAAASWSGLLVGCLLGVLCGNVLTLLLIRRPPT